MSGEQLGLTVGKLRAALAELDAEMPVVIRVCGEDDTFVGGILTAGVEHAHDEEDTPCMMLDCSDDPHHFEVVHGEADANCVTTPDGGCVGGPCMHDAPTTLDHQTLGPPLPVIPAPRGKAR